GASAYAPVQYKAPKEQTQSAASGGVLKALANLMRKKK
ncbi:conjugal transfer protein TrbD, partial [Acidithiobacillus ferrooxidans]|nr:conjugal transfer protein TrbD [Acidithiobacillus ferrooxidans]